jgi:hypothetical protein
MWGSVVFNEHPGYGSGTQTGNQWTDRWTSLVICIDGSRAERPVTSGCS